METNTTTKGNSTMIKVNDYKLGKAKFIKASSLKTLRHLVTIKATVTTYNPKTDDYDFENKVVCGWASDVRSNGATVSFTLVDDRGNVRGFATSIGAEDEVYVQHSNMFPFDLEEEFQANGENVKHFDWAYGTEWLNVKYTTVWGDSKIDPRTKAGKNAIAGLEVPTYEEYIATI